MTEENYNYRTSQHYYAINSPEKENCKSQSSPRR